MLLLALLVAAAPPPLPPLVGPSLPPSSDPAPAPAREAPVMAPLTAAQPFFNALAKGTTGVSFGLPGNVPQASVGATYFVANNLAVRLDFGLNAIFTSGGTATFDFNLALRLYQWRTGALAIYLAPDFAFARTAVTQVNTNGTVVTTNTGGVESIAFGGDGQLYVEVGSPSNAYGNPDRAYMAPGTPSKDPTEFLKTHGGW